MFGIIEIERNLVLDDVVVRIGLRCQAFVARGTSDGIRMKAEIGVACCVDWPSSAVITCVNDIGVAVTKSNQVLDSSWRDSSAMNERQHQRKIYYERAEKMHSERKCRVGMNTLLMPVKYFITLLTSLSRYRCSKQSIALTMRGSLGSEARIDRSGA